MHLRSIAPWLLLAFLIGCGGRRTLRETTRHSLDPNRSSSIPADRAADSIAVDVASLGDTTIVDWDLPDLSDSLASATEARMPSIEDLFDYPVIVNRRVLTWIDAYLQRGRKSFEVSLRRSGRYLPMARRIFAEEGIPQDLAFLAHIESGFRPGARSYRSACGLWQFMRGTAKLHGLRCDDLVDERLDPETSTRAAARLLRALHEKYDDWHLALAAYNAGSGKVDRAIRRTEKHDFWEIAGTRYLRRETRNFVPATLAATILAKSPGAYGLTEVTDPPIAYDTLTVRTATDLRVIARVAELSEAELAELNPALLYGQTPPKARYAVRLPVSTREAVATALAEVPSEERLLFHRHAVRKGDTLYDLAREYGTTVGAIQQENRLGRKTLIRVGKVLHIPNRSPKRFAGAGSRGVSEKARGVNRGSDTAAEIASSDTTQIDLGRGPSTAHLVEEARTALAEVRTRPRIHVVQRGDTLSGIAHLYDVPLSRLFRWNGLGPRSVIRPGQEIVTQAE